MVIILNNLCDGGDFSHEYIIVYQYFGLQPKHRKSQNEFQWTTKHVFQQDYFLHMQLALKAKHFEFIEYNFFAKWFFK